jgi:hypothetical protein
MTVVALLLQCQKQYNGLDIQDSAETQDSWPYHFHICLNKLSQSELNLYIEISHSLISKLELGANVKSYQL